MANSLLWLQHKVDSEQAQNMQNYSNVPVVIQRREITKKTRSLTFVQLKNQKAHFDHDGEFMISISPQNISKISRIKVHRTRKEEKVQWQRLNQSRALLRQLP